MCLKCRSTRHIATGTEGRAAAMKGEAHISMQEELLRIIYYKVVDLSTKILLKKLGSMARDTFRALGFISPQEYCRRKLAWSQSDTESFLSHTEIKYIKDVNADTEYKLLTKVWKELGETVVQKVDAQKLLLQKAIYDPPVDLDEEHLRKLIQSLHLQEKDLTDAVRKACQNLLEEEMRSLFEPKRNISSVFREISRLKEDSCLFSISRAVSAMRYEETHSRESWCQSFGGDPYVSENNSPDFDYLIKEVSSCCDDQKKITRLLVNIKQLYIDLIHRSLVPDITNALISMVVRNIGPHFHNWRQELQNLQQDFESRLEAFGRSECSSYHAAFRAAPVDVFRWLLTRNGEPLEISKTALSLVKLDTGKELMLEHLVEEGSSKPRVVIVYGPAGSGKTWLCHHLQKEWCYGCSSLGFIRELQLLVFLREDNISHESFSHYLKNVMHPKLLAGIHESQVIKSLCRFKVCFLMDSSAGCKPEFTSAVSEVMGHLNNNIAIITTRPEARRDIRTTMTHLQADEAYLQPLGEYQLKVLCLDYLKLLNNVEEEPVSPLRTGCNHHAVNSNITREVFVLEEDASVAVEKVLQTLKSEERKDLLYPLPVAYLLWLWLQDPKLLIKVTNISKLFAKVISVCEQLSNTNTVRLRFPTGNGKKARGQEPLGKLASCASEVFSSKILSWGCEDLIEYKNFSNSLYPFLGHFKHHPLQPFKTWQFLHPFLVEILFAWDTHRKNLDLGCKRKLAPNWKQVENTENNGGKYVTVIRLLSGFHCGEVKTVPASFIVKLFKCGGVADDDFPTWLSLLRETTWSPPLEKAVKCVMKSSKTWTVPHANLREVEAVVQLVSRHVYCPRDVIVDTNPSPEVIRMIAQQSSINVRIIPQVFKDSNPGDSLLDALRDAGNVTEFTGKIGKKGACALGCMTRLRSLDIRLTSLAALTAFSVSLRKLLALRELHIHLSKNDSTPIVRIPQLAVPTRHVDVYLNLHGIRDNTCKWAVEVCKKLKCSRKEVYLWHSILSPHLLQDIKHQIHPTAVHISP